MRNKRTKVIFLLLSLLLRSGVFFSFVYICIVCLRNMYEFIRFTFIRIYCGKCCVELVFFLCEWNKRVFTKIVIYAFIMFSHPIYVTWSAVVSYTFFYLLFQQQINNLSQNGSMLKFEWNVDKIRLRKPYWESPYLFDVLNKVHRCLIHHLVDDRMLDTNLYVDWMNRMQEHSHLVHLLQLIVLRSLRKCHALLLYTLTGGRERERKL